MQGKVDIVFATLIVKLADIIFGDDWQNIDILLEDVDQ